MKIRFGEIELHIGRPERSENNANRMCLDAIVLKTPEGDEYGFGVTALNPVFAVKETAAEINQRVEDSNAKAESATDEASDSAEAADPDRISDAEAEEMQLAELESGVYS